MRRPISRPEKTRHIAMVLSLLFGAVACHHWVTTTASPTVLVRDTHPSKIRITTTDSERVTLNHPTMSGDSIHGSWSGRMPLQFRDGLEGHRATIALTSVQKVEQRRFALGRTILMAVPVTYAALLGLILIVVASGGLAPAY